MSSLKFSLKTSTVPVTLEANGKVVDYELREMTAAARDTYLDSLGERLRVDKDGKPAGIKKFEGMQADLLTRCLFSTQQNKTVSRDEVQGWPSSVVSALFKEAQKINLLNEEKDAGELKND